MPIIDLNQLPAPDVVEELDFETILAERKATLISLYPEDQQEAVARTLMLESEPLVKLLEENAYRELIWRQRVNEAARAVMLACAAGNDLDVIGANYNTTRLTITPADDSTLPPTPAVMESDTDYRLRIQQAFEGLSVAGSVGAYQYHGRSADGRVADISVTSPSPACVTISVLSRENNGVASEDLLAVVRNALNGEDVRPVADRVTVQSAAIVEYQINATLYLYPGPESEPIRAAAVKKLEAYITAQHRLGRDIRLSAIYAALHVEGVQRVELAAPLADTGVTAKWLHTKDPKPQKQKVKLKRKKKEKHLRALEHPKAKPVTQKKAPKVPEAREGEYMAGEADNVFALTTVYATKAQAMRAAQAKWDKLQRGVAEFSISLATGRADIYTETPVRVSGFKRVIDEQDWTITKVTHFLNNSGFTTSLELEVRLSDVEYETEDDE